MAGFATYPALLPTLQKEWGLSNSEAGLLSGVYFAGYMAAVPVLTSLTDRIDARRIYAFSCGLSALGALGFAGLAHGLASALVFQALSGAGLGGTYMPGLKALTDRVEGPLQSRSLAFYTSSFGFGTTFSLLLAGFLEPGVGWRWTFALAGACPILAGLLVLRGLKPVAPHPPVAQPGRLLDFRPVLKNRAALGYILGYGAHCWELFGLRSWMVAFFAFSAGLDSAGSSAWMSPASAAAVINLLGPVASILGNEVAGRLGRGRVVLGVMGLSGGVACAMGFAASLPWSLVFVLMVLYYLLVMGDSAALTAGVVATARPEQRGSTMALHSFFGFGAGFVAPLVFGAVLDVAGGNDSVVGWGLAFVSLGIGCLLGPAVAAIGRRRG